MFDMAADSDNLGLRVFEAFNEVKKQGAQIRPIKNLRPSEFHILLSLHWLQEHKEGAPHDAATVSQLAERARVSMPAVSQVLRLLEEKGLLARTFKREDRRVVYVTLTEEGRALLLKAQELFFSYLNEMARRMGEEESEELIRLLNRFGSILEEVKKDLGGFE